MRSHNSAHLTLLCGVFLLLLQASPLSAQSFIRGDCNGDGSRNIGDPISLLDQLFSGGTPAAPIPCEDACDANDDGSLDIGDVISMLSFLFDGGTIAEPTFECGFDMTCDSLTCVTAPTGCPDTIVVKDTLDPQNFETSYALGWGIEENTGYESVVAIGYSPTTAGCIHDVAFNFTYFDSGTGSYTASIPSSAWDVEIGHFNSLAEFNADETRIDAVVHGSSLSGSWSTPVGTTQAGAVPGLGGIPAVPVYQYSFNVLSHQFAVVPGQPNYLAINGNISGTITPGMQQSINIGEIGSQDDYVFQLGSFADPALTYSFVVSGFGLPYNDMMVRITIGPPLCP